ncbi:hypothetical protein DSCO28_18260 [Desulfosarcina ovata subsp. sediminis]|uniref:DUF86 domain-containing protein n=1 Tax=Desulfosarcina ovata subsp. sediminis TaxID=885957 RepID=A0A5K7ZPY7_9BACT|nr:DUF86 domain-containing protein [Desulfosarcina ovata]BBO81260.1 hypothetical protein DSCO28_18260 [Desulfosarcina ovata subsp. sediminis]
MPDPTLLIEKLEQINEAIGRMKRRFQGIGSPDHFLDTPEGLDKLDGISMMLIAIGEAFKKIDEETKGNLLSLHPEINWKGVKGVRDVLSHNYFNIDAEEIFFICQKNLEPLQNAVTHFIDKLRNEI